MKKNKYLFLVTTLLLQLFLQTVQAQFKVIGYYPTYAWGYPGGINSLDLAKLTHVNIAFANPDASGNLIMDYGTAGNISTVVTACHTRGLKVFISLGGGAASGGNYQTLLNNATSLNNFVAKIVAFTITNGLDGVDVDIEGNILNGSTLNAAQYENFVSALAVALHANNLKISSALGTWFANNVTNLAASRFDWINMMSYDLCGSWTGPCQHSSYSFAVNDFNYWKNTKGVPASKLIVGVPFYGYGWGSLYNTGIRYCDIVANYPGSENNDQVGGGGDVIYYNGVPTIKQKTTFAVQNAGGIMMWELTQDCATSDSRSLLRAINQVIVALPVTWVDFRALYKNDVVEVSWSTMQETQNDYFIVERSKDGLAFEELKKVKAIGASTTLNTYEYIDLQPLSGNSFYRIKQVDLNGNFTYTSIVEIDRENTELNLAEINPNPTSQHEISIQIKNSCSIVLLDLTDMLGTTYYSNSLVNVKKGESFSIAMNPPLSPGLYILSVIGNGKVDRIKVRVN